MNNRISKILVPYDFSLVAKNALQYAMNFAQEGPHKVITLLYAANDKNLNEKERQMAETISSLKPPANIEVKGEVVIDEIVKAIMDTQRETFSEIIIMGTKGQEHISDKAISNTSKLTLEATCPIVVVPHGYENFRLKNITLAIGKNEIDDPKVLGTLLMVARKFDAKIHVLTIFEDGDEDYLLESKNESILEYYFEKYYSYSSSVKSKHIADSIMSYDKHQGVDMLTIIPRNHTKKTTATQGRLTSFLTMNTDIPLLTLNLKN